MLKMFIEPIQRSYLYKSSYSHVNKKVNPLNSKILLFRASSKERQEKNKKYFPGLKIRKIQSQINKKQHGILYTRDACLFYTKKIIPACVNTMPRMKDISNDHGEAIVADHQLGNGYKVISEQSGGKHSNYLPRRTYKSTPKPNHLIFKDLKKRNCKNYIKKKPNNLGLYKHHLTC